MGKLIKLFVVGLIITLISVVVLIWGVNSGSVDTMIIVIFPGAIGVALMAISASIAMKKWVRGLERD